MTTKLGPNDRCPCGSGKKVKKCCKVQRPAIGFTARDRDALFAEADAFIEEFLVEAEQAAYEEFWETFASREDELSQEFTQVSDDVQLMWFLCDYEIEDGKTPLDFLLAQRPNLSLGARAFANTIRHSSLRLYEATAVVPGVSITLRDMLEGESVTVAERSASRSVTPSEWLVARVVPKGVSGQPEMERGLLAIPPVLRQELYAQLTDLHQEALREHDLASFYDDLPPFFHEAWVGCVLEPQLPALYNTDGEPLLVTRVHFDVSERALLEQALATHEALSREGDRFSWSGTNKDGAIVSLGWLDLRENALVLEANSRERAERGVTLVCTLAGPYVKRRATSHEDLERSLRDGLKGGGAPGRQASEVPRAITQALVLAHYEKHYRAWVDEPVPALDGATPRAAAKKPALRTRVVALIEGLESMYEVALQKGEPAYDPAWMWAELGLKR